MKSKYKGGKIHIIYFWMITGAEYGLKASIKIGPQYTWEFEALG